MELWLVRKIDSIVEKINSDAENPEAGMAVIEPVLDRLIGPDMKGFKGTGLLDLMEPSNEFNPCKAIDRDFRPRQGCITGLTKSLSLLMSDGGEEPEPVMIWGEPPSLFRDSAFTNNN